MGPCLAVFGRDEDKLAAAALEAWSLARRLKVQLRHREGSSGSEEELNAHPDALLEALQARAARGPTVGVGAGFAACVDADLVVFCGSIDAIAQLSPSARDAAREAQLQMSEPTLDVMRELGRALAERS